MGQTASLTRADPHRAIEVAEASPAVMEDPIVQHYVQRGPLPDVGADMERAHAPTASELAYGDNAPAAKVSSAGPGHAERAPTPSPSAATRKPAHRGKQASSLARLKQAGGTLLDQVVMSATEFLDRMPGVRRLTPAEIDRHRKIFGSSIDFSAVRIIGVGPEMFEAIHGGMTLGNYMILIGNWNNQTSVAHELTHVWQSQNGRHFKYIPEAASAIVDGEAGYDYAIGMRAGNSWSQLNPEQQASYVEDSYQSFMNAAQFDAPVVCGTEPAPDQLASDPYFQQARYQLQCGVGAPGRRPKPPAPRR